MRINVRLNPEQDKDIIQALGNAKNVSLAVRQLLRSGLSQSPHAYASKPVDNPQPIKPINTSSGSILSNILEGFE